MHLLDRPSKDPLIESNIRSATSNTPRHTLLVQLIDATAKTCDFRKVAYHIFLDFRETVGCEGLRLKVEMEKS